MTTGHQQGDKGKGRRRLFQHRRQQVAFHMMHAQRRHAPGKGQRTGTGAAHQQRAHQTGACGVGHRIHLSRLQPGLGKNLAHQRHQTLDVIARGQLGHNAAIDAVQVDLAEQRIGQ